jgi:hypothetical protein
VGDDEELDRILREELDWNDAPGVARDAPDDAVAPRFDDLGEWDE